MNRLFSKALVITALSFLAVQLHAQVNDTYVIPAAANTDGARGTKWTTDLNVFNPQGNRLNVAILFIPTGGGQAVRKDVPINPNQNWNSVNVVGNFFGRVGTGSLLVAAFPENNPGDVIARSFTVTSTTFNNSSTGTYGTATKGVWAGIQDFNTDGITAVAHGIRHVATSSPSGYRTSVGALNLGRFSVKMLVTVYDASGLRIADRVPFTIPPQAHLQEALPVLVDRGTVEFFVEDPSNDAVVLPYATVVDNLSGDPIYLEGTLLAGPSELYGKGTSTPRTPRKVDIGVARALALNALRID